MRCVTVSLLRFISVQFLLFPASNSQLLPVTTPDVTYAFWGDPVKIPCEFPGALLIVRWEKVESGLVASFAFGERSEDKIKTGYNITEDGALIVEEMTIEKEGLYECEAYNTEHTSGTSISKLLLIVKPDVPYPLIEKCNTSSPCQIFLHTSEKHINLSCSVSHSRPPTVLKWRVLSNKTLDTVSSITYDEYNVTATTISVLQYDMETSSKEFACVAVYMHTPRKEQMEIVTVTLTTTDVKIYSNVGPLPTLVVMVTLFGCLLVASVILNICLCKERFQRNCISC